MQWHVILKPEPSWSLMRKSQMDNIIFTSTCPLFLSHPRFSSNHFILPQSFSPSKPTGFVLHFKSQRVLS